MATDQHGDEVTALIPADIPMVQCGNTIPHNGHTWTQGIELFKSDNWCPGTTAAERVTIRCGDNDVHEEHQLDADLWCAGVDRFGKGLYVNSRNELDPFPKHPEKFHMGVLSTYVPGTFTDVYPAPPEVAVKVEGAPFVLPWVPGVETPMLGINDDQGRSLVEFRVVGNRVEARYYESDLDEAAKAFIKYMVSLKTDDEA